LKGAKYVFIRNRRESRAWWYTPTIQHSGGGGRRSESLRPVWATWPVPGQPGVHSETISYGGKKQKVEGKYRHGHTQQKKVKQKQTNMVAAKKISLYSVCLSYLFKVIIYNLLHY
jgi:hypothetical protein